MVAGRGSALGLKLIVGGASLISLGCSDSGDGLQLASGLVDSEVSFAVGGLASNPWVALRRLGAISERLRCYTR